MSPRHLAAVVVFVLCALAQLGLAQNKPPENQGPPPLPTMDELRQMYENGDYQAAVQQIARVLRLRGAPAEPYDRDALLLLRGKTLLAMDDPRTARRAFDEAQKSPQSEIAMTAHGYFTLLSRSKLSVYTRRSGDKAQINVADPRNQSVAFNALLDDELPAFQKEAAAAAKADNLNPAIALVPKMLDLAGVEFAATGKFERIQPIASEIGEHARELIERELTTQDQKITATENLANQLIDTGGYVGTGPRRRWWWSAGVTRRGLVSDERESLYETIQYLTKIEDTARRAQDVAKAIDSNADAWNSVVDHAAQVKTHAQSVLEAEGVRTSNDLSNR